MKKWLGFLIAGACIFFGIRACSIRDDLRANGQIAPAKVISVEGVRGGIAITYTYFVRGKIYTRTSVLGGRYAMELKHDSVYIKYLPTAPSGNVHIYFSREEITSPLYN